MSRAPAAADVFHAIADPTRRQILERLATSDLPVMEIAKSFLMTQPAVSQHLRVLRKAELVKQRQSGRQRIYSANARQLKEVYDWVSCFGRFWDQKLGALGTYLDKEAGKVSPKKR